MSGRGTSGLFNDKELSANYEGGDNWVIDDITGFKIKASDAVYGVGLEQGLLVHKDVASEGNPQLHLKPRNDSQLANLIRDKPAENFGSFSSEDH